MSIRDDIYIDGIYYSKEVEDILNESINYCQSKKYCLVTIFDILIAMTRVGIYTKKVLLKYGINESVAEKISIGYVIREKSKNTVLSIEVVELIRKTAFILTPDKTVYELDLLKALLVEDNIKKAMGKDEYKALVAYKIVGHIDNHAYPLTSYPNYDKLNDTYSKEEKITYCEDMTYKAYNGKYPKIIGRDAEILRIEEILQKNRKSNPMLVGEPGVGKTAVIEHLCNKIVEGQIPTLKNKKIMALDLAFMISGARYRGDFEERLKQVLDSVAQKNDIILFVDEIHALKDLGGAEGAVTADNIIKPYLCDGRISLIGSTTFEEYRNSFEKDLALERRFDKVIIEEPTPVEAKSILMSLKEEYIKKYDITISDELIGYIVDMSKRYLSYRRFPDKAIDVLSNAYAKVYVKCSKDNRHVKEIRKKDIDAVLSQMSNIPMTNLSKSEVAKIMELPREISKYIIGQDHAIDSISRMLKVSKSGLGDPNKPMSFIFYGPTGVGKTEIAKILAMQLFGDKEFMIRFDMSEYSEEHSISKFIGSAPGYIGYEDSGKLIKEVKNKPYSILLFDEIEKAHPAIFNVFLQILDDGILTNARGETVNFKNTIIIMTSNIGFSTPKVKTVGFNNLNDVDSKKLEKNRMYELEKVFRPEFLNRIDDIILFNKLTVENVKKIVSNMLQELKKDCAKLGLDISYDEDLIEYITKESYDEKYGARPIKRFIESKIKFKLAEIIMNKNSNSVEVSIKVEDKKLNFNTKENLFV